MSKRRWPPPWATDALDPATPAKLRQLRALARRPAQELAIFNNALAIRLLTQMP